MWFNKKYLHILCLGAIYFLLAEVQKSKKLKMVNKVSIPFRMKNSFKFIPHAKVLICGPLCIKAVV